MSALVNAVAISNYETPEPLTFSANSVAGVLRTAVPVFGAAVASAFTPLLYGGCSLLDLLATSSDVAARDFQFYTGKVVTTQGGGTGAITTGATTLTRVTGSWVTEGYQIGDLITVQSPGNMQPTNADGLVGIVSNVTALVLTFVNVGAAFPAATALNAGSGIYVISPWQRVTVPASAGTSASVPNFSVLGSSSESSQLRSEKKLDATSIVLAAPVTALTAGSSYVSFSAVVGRV